MEYANISDVHFELRFFPSMWKVHSSETPTSNLVLTVHTLNGSSWSTGSSTNKAQAIAR